MKGKKTRRTYLINPSKQTKFIAFAIVPVLIMGLFSTYLWVHSAKWMYWMAEQRPLEEMIRIQYATYSSAQGKEETSQSSQLNRLQRDFSSLQKTVESGYVSAIEDFNKAAWLSFFVLTAVFISSAFFALLYSHRISGAVYRLKKCTDMLAQGHDIPPVRLRKKDEFQDLAASLEHLRVRLKEKGVLD